MARNKIRHTLTLISTKGHMEPPKLGDKQVIFLHLTYFHFDFCWLLRNSRKETLWSINSESPDFSGYFDYQHIFFEDLTLNWILSLICILVSLLDLFSPNFEDFDSTTLAVEKRPIVLRGNLAQATTIFLVNTGT